ncbi:hypothetical protein LX36DRAFT_722139, partial [Colletotrichum falcatum]
NTFRSIVQTWTSATEFTPLRTSWGFSVSSQLNTLINMRNSVYIADIVECGSLTLSILRGDKIAVS